MPDKPAVLADGTNLGLARMADASRGLGYLHLVNMAQWHISDDNYIAARAAIINAHHRHPMAAIWNDGTTSSSDGQYFRAGGRAGPGGSVNAKYGIDPHDFPHSQMAPNICAKRGWAASIWANRSMSGSRRKSVMFGMSS